MALEVVVLTYYIVMNDHLFVALPKFDFATLLKQKPGWVKVSNIYDRFQKRLNDLARNCNDAALAADLTILRKDCERIQRIYQVQVQVHKLEKDVTNLFFAADKHESWTRRCTLILNGIPEERGECTNRIAIDLFHHMGLEDVTPQDICRTHRNSPRVEEGRHRPIFVRFTRRDVRDNIYFARDRLRKTDRYRAVFIDENLTKHNYRSRI